MRKPLVSYMIVTRTPDGTQESRVGVRAVNADIAIRTVKRERASRTGAPLRQIVTVAAVPTQEPATVSHDDEDAVPDLTNDHDEEQE